MFLQAEVFYSRISKNADYIDTTASQRKAGVDALQVGGTDRRVYESNVIHTTSCSGYRMFRVEFEGQSPVQSPS